jgi:predicted amidohydrolase
MQYDFVKVRAASPHLQVADVLYNLEEIKKAFVGAEKDGVELLVLPELSLC